jgi:hypothetical protein
MCIYEEKYKMYIRKITMLMSMALSCGMHMGMQKEEAPRQHVIGNEMQTQEEHMGPKESDSTVGEYPAAEERRSCCCYCFRSSAPKKDPRIAALQAAQPNNPKTIGSQKKTLG